MVHHYLENEKKEDHTVHTTVLPFPQDATKPDPEPVVEPIPLARQQGFCNPPPPFPPPPSPQIPDLFGPLEPLEPMYPPIAEVAFAMFGAFALGGLTGAVLIWSFSKNKACATCQ